MQNAATILLAVLGPVLAVATYVIMGPLSDRTASTGLRLIFVYRRTGPSLLVAEARLRPLTNPMKMNGCAMVVVNPPAGAEAAASEICGWVAGALGEPGGRAEVWTF